MILKKWILTLPLCVCLQSIPAYADLLDLGNGLIYDAATHLTWTQDANLLKTLSTSTPNPLSAISQSNGATTWDGAQAFISYLNRIDYKGYNDWRLPTTSPIAYTFAIYDPLVKASELGNLFYNELGGVSVQSIATVHNNDYALFKNLQSANYWSSTEWINYIYGTQTPATPTPTYAWYFEFSSGGQYAAVKSSYFIPWAVRGTSVTAPVPVPGTAILLVSGILGWLRLRVSKTA